MTSHPCAKINIGLYITERRPDGYHNLETIFYPIPIRDELTWERNGRDRDHLTVSGIPVAGDPNDNLVLRAVRLLREIRRVPYLDIHLEKNIPSGAGLGGGSSDAAYMMTTLNRRLELSLTNQEIERLIRSLGADCPFFVRHRPVFATGIGDQFKPIELDLSGWHLVLVKPDDFISTREAYAGIIPQDAPYSLLEAIHEPVEQWPLHISNDFETNTFPDHPTVAAIKQNLYRLGASYASMSGSGSSVYGLFKQPLEDAHKIFAPHFVFTAQL